MATWPAGSKASTANLDSGSDSPRLARSDIKTNVDNVNSIIDMFNIDSPTANQILKYNNSNARFELTADSAAGGITFVGDDSSGTLVNIDETFKIAGGTNITTAVSGDTVTITGAAAPVTALNNATANELVTVGSTTTELDAESGLTFDGSTLAVTGAITATTSIANDAISIDDNVITTTRSNDNLFIETNGTGTLQLSAAGGDFANFTNTTRYTKGNRLYYEDLTHTLNVDRDYRNSLVSNYKATTGQTSSSSNDRFRNMANMQYDLNGSSFTSASSYLSRGPIALSGETTLKNSSSSDGAASAATGLQGGVWLKTDSTGDITITGNNSGIAAHSSWMDMEANTGSTITVDNGYSYYSTGFQSYGGGTKTMNNFYHFFANTSATDPTKEYAFVTENPLMCSAVGTLEQYREKVNALTNATTITVDCALAPIHTVTIAQATGFNFKNLATGQTVTLVVKQDGSGSQTATFTEEDSTAILFPGGQPTLSTAANSVDVLTFFNTGSEVLGNCAKAYAAS